METPENPSRKCVHCGKEMSADEYKRSGICPSCEKSVKKPPKPEGQFIDVDTVGRKEMVRIDDWAIKIMGKHERHLSDDIPLGKVFIQESLKPEDVDIPQIYDFTDLSYQIYRKYDRSWAVRILQAGRMIVEAAYLKT